MPEAEPMTDAADNVADPVRARAIRRAELARRALADAHDELASLRQALAAAERLGADRAREIERLAATVRDLSDAHGLLTGSTLWRATAPLRAVLEMLPASVRRRIARRP